VLFAAFEEEEEEGRKEDEGFGSCCKGSKGPLKK